MGSLYVADDSKYIGDDSEQEIDPEIFGDRCS